jgi:hypothetical protein
MRSAGSRLRRVRAWPSRVAAATAAILLAGCGPGGGAAPTPADPATAADGTAHSAGAPAPARAADSTATPAAHDHHDKARIGTVKIGDLEVELSQGPGAIQPGAQCHLIVKLPDDDGGATSVRAWIGVEDRSRSIVGIGVYATMHEEYRVHTVAPIPLPEESRWWIEVERPDGSIMMGSAPALR